MTLLAGTAAVQADESITGTGLAVAMAQADAANLLTNIPTPDVAEAQLRAVFLKAVPPIAPDAATVATSRANAASLRMGILSGAVTRANAYAGAIVSYLTANAEVQLSTVVATVGTATHAGRIPSSTVAGTPIDGPTVAVTSPVSSPSPVRLL